jgi:hypothetical protein
MYLVLPLYYGAVEGAHGTANAQPERHLLPAAGDFVGIPYETSPQAPNLAYLDGTMEP